MQTSPLPGEVTRAAHTRAHEGLALVSSRWGLPVLEQLVTGPRRFNELQRSVPGISHRMLAVTLMRCVAQGVVERTDHEANPPHVDYRLTDDGRGLLTTAWGFCAWSSQGDGPPQGSVAGSS